MAKKKRTKQQAKKAKKTREPREPRESQSSKPAKQERKQISNLNSNSFSSRFENNLYRIDPGMDDVLVEDEFLDTLDAKGLKEFLELMAMFDEEPFDDDDLDESFDDIKQLIFDVIY